MKGSEQPEDPQQLEAAHDVYALGDCCARMDLALPALAQVGLTESSRLKSSFRTHADVNPLHVALAPLVVELQLVCCSAKAKVSSAFQVSIGPLNSSLESSGFQSSGFQRYAAAAPTQPHKPDTVPEAIGLAGRQVAEQQGKYLAKALNEEAKARVDGSEIQLEPFRYKQLGAMASVGMDLLPFVSVGWCVRQPDLLEQLLRNFYEDAHIQADGELQCASHTDARMTHTTLSLRVSCGHSVTWTGQLLPCKPAALHIVTFGLPSRG